MVDLRAWSTESDEVREKKKVEMRSKMRENEAESKREREGQSCFVSTPNQSPNETYMVSHCGKQNLNTFVDKKNTIFKTFRLLGSHLYIRLDTIFALVRDNTIGDP